MDFTNCKYLISYFGPSVYYVLYLPYFHNSLKQIFGFCVSFCNSNKEVLSLLNAIQLQVRQNTLLQKQKMAGVLVTSSSDLTTEHGLGEHEENQGQHPGHVRIDVLIHKSRPIQCGI